MKCDKCGKDKPLEKYCLDCDGEQIAISFKNYMEAQELINEHKHGASYGENEKSEMLKQFLLNIIYSEKFEDMKRSIRNIVEQEIMDGQLETTMIIKDDEDQVIYKEKLYHKTNVE